MIPSLWLAELASIRLRTPWPPEILIAAAAVAIGGAAWLYARERALSPVRRLLLALLRAIVFVLLIGVLLEPVALVTRSIVVPSNLLVLLDASESMAVADPRRSEDEVLDAALALGTLRFREPALQAALARAIRTLETSKEALVRDLPDSEAHAREAGRAVDLALDAARAAAEAGLRADGSAPEPGSGLEPGSAAAAEALARIEPLALRARSSLDATVRTGASAEAAAELSRVVEGLAEILASLRDPADAERVDAASPRRIDLARGILSHPDLEFLRKPQLAVAVRHFRFGERLEPSEGGGHADALASQAGEPTAKATSLGSAIEEAVARHAGQAIDGVVVLTDGASNQGLDPLEAARRLGARSIPIFPVGLGLSSPDDIRVRGLIVQDAVLSGEKVPIRVDVSANGYRGRTVDIVATLDGVEVARKPLVIDSARATVELDFVPPARQGAADLEVSVAPLPDEASRENNRVLRRIEIIDEKIKVLYVEGKPRWEYRYLRAVLLRDARLDVRFLLTEGDPDLPRTSPGYLSRFPDEARDSLRHDLVILGNVPARAFSAGQTAWLADLVRKHGGSFLLLAGDQAPAGYSGTPLSEILSVGISESAMEAVDPGVHPLATEAGIRSGILSLDDLPARSETLWSRVRPLHRLPALSGPKPGATVLATLSSNSGPDPYPLIVWHRSGTGKCLFVATDSLWRLRRGIGDRHHARFWGQAIRFLTISRLLGENRRVRLEADPREARTGERVVVHAALLDEAFEPARLPSFALEASSAHLAGPQILKLDPVPGSPGLYSGSFTPEREGTYVLQPAGAERELAKPLEVTANAADRESLQPNLEEDVLRAMAEVSGGRYLEVRDLPKLAARLPLDAATRTVKDERPLWDRWIVLAILLAAAGLEWFVRRRHDLP